MSKNSVMVKVSRVITEGKSYFIAPTAGYSGVIPGMVEVVAIGFRDSFGNTEIGATIDTFMEVDYSPEEYMDDAHQWVAYKYIHGEDDGIQVFPACLFVDHTIAYY